MNRRDLIAIFTIALLARATVAAFQAHPGYMDAYYYTVGAERLAGGFGFSEPYVWNYLDDPASLPHPSHLYWMPLPSMLGAASMAIFGSGYRAAQIPFVLLSAVVPVIAYVAAWCVTPRRRSAWIAALLAIFSGFYVPLWGVPESFAPYAAFGSLALLLAGVGLSKRAMLAAGLCAGLAHLSRADGVLLLFPILWVVMQKMKAESGTPAVRGQVIETDFVLHFSALILGYLLIMLPWFVRNLAVVGAPISPAGTQALWLCDYDELFSFGVKLDLTHLQGCGIDQVAVAKLRALGSGLVHLIAENGLVFLAPLMAVGLWRMRRDRIFRPAILYLILLFLAMTLAFTFVGDRGGLFHSSGALMPFLCAAAPIGLDAIVETVARRRRAWKVESARRVLGVGIVVLAAIFSLAIVWSRVIGPDWNQADSAYRDAGAWLAGRGDIDSIVVAGNPPGFTYHTGHPSIVIPNGGVTTLLEAAGRFDAQWLVLDANHPIPLAALYDDPRSDPRLRLSATFGDTYLFEIARRLAPRVSLCAYDRWWDW